jgi:hypothetical protein
MGKERITAALILLGFAGVAALLFGGPGMKTVAAVFLFYFLPARYALERMGLEEIEKNISAFFLGIGVLPIFTYYLGLFISLKHAASLIAVFCIVGGIFLEWKSGMKEQKKDSSSTA